MLKEEKKEKMKKKKGKFIKTYTSMAGIDMMIYISTKKVRDPRAPFEMEIEERINNGDEWKLCTDIVAVSISRSVDWYPNPWFFRLFKRNRKIVVGSIVKIMMEKEELFPAMEKASRFSMCILLQNELGQASYTEIRNAKLSTASYGAAVATDDLQIESQISFACKIGSGKFTPATQVNVDPKAGPAKYRIDMDGIHKLSKKDTVVAVDDEAITIRRGDLK